MRAMQIMHEIIEKSKMYRAMKAKQKEEDEDAMDALNEEFKVLVRSAALASFVKPKGFTK